ncbi:hypothetical protein NDU88_000659 [Pleurodeles waltl]|uniref:Uncharacterized protein n=1 Tax=Pleurodeles waltl TaxID=8319 RepID=A0AAV7P4S4_PLEWA|nr:hypothetical protein NDU88_000659 [Pleurodeles waltl]
MGRGWEAGGLRVQLADAVRASGQQHRTSALRVCGTLSVPRGTEAGRASRVGAPRATCLFVFSTLIAQPGTELQPVFAALHNCQTHGTSPARGNVPQVAGSLAQRGWETVPPSVETPAALYPCCSPTPVPLLAWGIGRKPGRPKITSRSKVRPGMERCGGHRRKKRGEDEGERTEEGAPVREVGHRCMGERKGVKNGKSEMSEGERGVWRESKGGSAGIKQFEEKRWTGARSGGGALIKADSGRKEEVWEGKERDGA